MMSTVIASALGIAFGIFAFAAVAGLAGSLIVAATAAALVALGTTVAARKRSPVALDPAACSKGLKILSAAATVLALFQLVRLTVFTVDPSQVSYSTIASSDWEVQHSCLSAYFVAAEAADSVGDVYMNSLYSAPDDDPTTFPRKARMLGPFRVDVFEYPPPFLLLPRALRLLAPDFLRHRMLWFGLHGAFVLIVMLLVARSLEPKAGTPALLLLPLVWLALPTLSTLQKGNVQVMVVAASMLAMLLFERRRWASGGALLAFATVSKLYPGLLVIYLLARRQWRAAVWTGAWGLAFVVLTFVDIGPGVYRAFLDHLPGILGGEAFPAFRNPAAKAINFSVPGLVFKLQLFGVPGMSFGAAKLVGWMYTLIAVGATIAAGLRSRRERETPLVWLA